MYHNFPPPVFPNRNRNMREPFHPLCAPHRLLGVILPDPTRSFDKLAPQPHVKRRTTTYVESKNKEQETAGIKSSDTNPSMHPLAGLLEKRVNSTPPLRHQASETLLHLRQNLPIEAAEGARVNACIKKSRLSDHSDRLPPSTLARSPTQFDILHGATASIPKQNNDAKRLRKQVTW